MNNELVLRDGFDVLVARRKAGLKQYQLAARLGVSHTVVCDIERGRRSVSPEMAERLREALCEVAV
jgi:ribosome-binding protein aMBF1 (putative translation factor)